VDGIEALVERYSMHLEAFQSASHIRFKCSHIRSECSRIRYDIATYRVHHIY
jgi:hypothetical protein